MERFCTLVLIRDLMFRSKIDAIAEALGTQVYYGADLASARSLLDQVRPHLVLTDLSDPNCPSDSGKGSRGDTCRIRFACRTQGVGLGPPRRLPKSFLAQRILDETSKPACRPEQCRLNYRRISSAQRHLRDIF